MRSRTAAHPALPGRRRPVRAARSRLARAIARRLVAAAVVALVVVSITFVVVRLIPGNPAYLLAGGTTATAARVHQIERELGLDKPIPTQYVRFLKQTASLQLGTSLQSGHTVTSDLRRRIPATVELTLTGLGLGVVVGVGLGILLAVRRSGMLARLGEWLTIAAVATPEFVIGLVLIVAFYTRLGIAPAPVGRLSPGIAPPNGPTGLYVLDGVLHWRWDVVESALAHLALPSIALSFVAIPTLARVTRATVRSVMTEDFVLAARANGDSGLRLYLSRVLPVAAPPIVTTTGIICSYLLGGDFLIEKVFGWPGIGLYAVNATQLGDFAAIQGTVLLSAVAYVCVFLVVDIANAVLDPRTGALEG